MKKSLIIFFIILSVIGFSDLYSDAMKKAQDLFNKSMQKSDEMMEKYKTFTEKTFQEYKEKSEKIWGYYEELASSKWIDYETDLKTYSIVNFGDEPKIDIKNKTPGEAEKEITQYDATAYIEINTILDTGESTEKVAENVQKRLDGVMKEKNEYTGKPILEGIVEPGKIDLAIQKINDAAENPDKYKDIVLDKSKGTQPAGPVNKYDNPYEKSGNLMIIGKKDVEVEVKDVTVDNQKKTIYTVRIPMTDDHIYKLAKEYLEIINYWAEKLDMEPALIMAIIHTESSFNPKAVSKSYAYGLMQLKPKLGAVDGYYYLNNEKKSINPDDLVDPKTNIELGSGYYKMIYERYLKGIKNEDNKKYMSVAAYNWGPTNASELVKTSPVDSMTHDELVDFIEKNTREETYNYVLRISAREKEYRKYFEKTN